MKCYLWDRCKAEHERANPKFTEKLYFVGKLFKQPICGHCLIRFHQLTAPTPTDNSIIEMEVFRAIHPEYAAVLDELGKDKVHFELTCNVAVANPTSEPTRPEQVEEYPPLRPNIVVD